jgi:hypothetical protein
MPCFGTLFILHVHIYLKLATWMWNITQGGEFTHNLTFKCALVTAHLIVATYIVHFNHLFGICLKQKSVVERKNHCKFLISIHVIVAIVQMHGWKEIKL